MANGAFAFSQPSSAPLAPGRPGAGPPGQQNGFPQLPYGQHLQNHILLQQQSGAFPFLPPGARMHPNLVCGPARRYIEYLCCMADTVAVTCDALCSLYCRACPFHALPNGCAISSVLRGVYGNAGMQHLGSQFVGGANRGLTPQQAAAVAAFPFPTSAHMLSLAGFGNLSQQLGGANGLPAGFGPRKIDLKVLEGSPSPPAVIWDLLCLLSGYWESVPRSSTQKAVHYAQPKLSRQWQGA